MHRTLQVLYAYSGATLTGPHDGHEHGSGCRSGHDDASPDLALCGPRHAAGKE